MANRIKCLALDGGGVFGIGQAHILSQIDTSKFDMFVGTSIGSAISAGLASEMDRTKFVEFFHREMPRIFGRHLLRKINPFISKFPDKNLNSALKGLLKGRLRDVKKPLFITAASLAAARMKVFDSTDPDDGKMMLWEVCRSAVAAETYFPAWGGYADGAVFANNPSMVALAVASSKFGVPPSGVDLCSIGTGSDLAARLAGKPENRNIVWWGKWLLNVLLNGASNSMHEYFVDSMRCHKHLRIQFVRQKGWSMSNPKDMLAAEKAWAGDIATGVRKVKEFLS